MSPTSFAQLRLGSILAFLGVAIGAVGAHALRDVMAPDMAKVYETGVIYQLVHALAILALCPFAQHGSVRTAKWLFVAGVALFSGSLYALAITGAGFFGFATPLGGLAFLAGWLTLTLAKAPKDA